MRDQILEPAHAIANPPDPLEKPPEDDPRWVEAMETSGADDGEDPADRAPIADEYDDLGESYDATD
jgi:hypothetical protein